MLSKIIAILRGNVPFVWSWVYSDSLRTESFGIKCKLQNVGRLPTARIAQRCDFIDIHAKSGHGTIIELQKYETFKEFSILRPL
jgi:hypothetical protein